MNIKFSPPDITESEIAEVMDTLRSGWITTGPKTKRLEGQVADYTGVKRCACLGSQTACSEMALRLLNIGPGDEVITSAYTYTATASVIAHTGATIVLVDTQKDGLEMDYDALEAVITERTKVIIPVDLAGIPCDYDRVIAIAERKKSMFRPNGKIQQALGRIAVLADTAHSFGASRNGIMAGNMADFSAFSFHAVKNFTTAEGGALTWRTIPGVEDDEIYQQLQLFSLHGQSKSALDKTKLGCWEYDVVGPWYKCNMTDIAASLGLAQFPRYGEMLQKRKRIIQTYDAALRPLGLKTLEHYTDEYQSSGHLYLTRVPNITSEQRNEIIVKMAERGVPCNVHYKPLPLLTAYRNMGFDIADYPNAYAQFANEITLPLHTQLTDEEIEYIIAQYKDVLKEYGVSCC